MEEIEVQKFPIKITEDHLHESARQLISKIRPEWSSNNLSFKIFTDGITNRLIGVYNNNNNIKDDEHDMILIRIYGKNTDLFIDRNIEYRNMSIMFKNGLSAPVYGKFLNGICYGYTPGKVLDENLVRDSNVSHLIAEKLAHMHTLKPFSMKQNNNHHSSLIEACLFSDLERFNSLVDSALPIKLYLDKKLKYYCDKIDFNAEIDYLKRTLLPLQSPIVFCHNDLLLKNIIYDETKNSISFIDFEYSNYNYQAFDIANHFCEFCGIDTFDHKKYPDKKFQLKWLEIYLKKWYTLTNDEQKNDFKYFEENIQNLHYQVEKFTLASCLYWGVWALVQATNSSIDFDYITFACQRLDEYYRRKLEQQNA